MENISSKVVIITGASKGIGEETATYLAQHGARVILAARNEDRLKTIVDSIRLAGGQADYVPTDVTSQENMKRLVNYTLKQYGKIDVLVNNAGLQLNSKLNELNISEWDQSIDVNIKGVLYGIAAVLPTMREQQSGHIITFSSLMGHKVIPTTAIYSATKSAVRAISEGLRQEEVNAHIRTTIISPGMTDTGAIPELKDYPSLPPSSVARAVAYAINEPEHTSINELLVRPTAQEL